MIDIFFFLVCGGGSGRGGVSIVVHVFVTEGGVYFVCEWEMYWVGGDYVGHVQCGGTQC